MKKILQDIFYGNYEPGNYQFKRGSDYDKALQKLLKIEKALSSNLNKEKNAMLESLSNAYLETNLIETREQFIRGFCDGARLMLEVLYEEE